MEKRDIEFARILHNDSDTINYLTDPEHISEAQQEKWFEGVSLSKTSKRYVACSKEEYLIGVIRVDNIDYKNGNVMIGLDIDKHYRGNGYAYEIYETMIRYYFNVCGMHRIYLYVLSNNPRARHIYEKLGFKEEGVMKECVYRDGRYLDYVLMGMINNNV